MLSSNNPELDPQVLAEKLEQIAKHRRRSKPLFVGPAMGQASDEDENASRNNLSEKIERIPLIGPLAAKIVRRLGRIVAPGIGIGQRVRLVPGVGHVAAWAYAIVRLDKIRWQIAHELAELRHAQQQQHAQLNARLDRLDGLHIAGRLEYIESLDLASRLDQMMRASVERDNRIATLTQELRRLQQAQVAAPVSGNAAATLPAATPAMRPATIGNFDSDSFYVEFEGLFRGSREDIKERLKVYLPYVAHFVGNGDAHVIDVGCGRGEWLELMAEQRIRATGIDLNGAMVNACLERGHAAECMDAVAYLRQQPEGSIAAVTGFHIIEHLPFELLIALFDAALYALRSDGVIIFETPNPENLIVGSCNFYYDPTHLHPIVPAVAEFMARQRGFARAEILRLHPYPAGQMIAEDTEAARRLNHALYGPQDYAVLAWKVHGHH